MWKRSLILSIALSCAAVGVAIPSAGASVNKSGSGGLPSVHATGSTAHAVGTGPLSATGTNQDVTIYVVGSGLWVDSWWTSALAPKAEYTWASFWVNGTIVSQSNTIWTNPAQGEAVAIWGGLPGYPTGQGSFPNGTQLCVTWFQIPGKPCETVHN